MRATFAGAMLLGGLVVAAPLPKDDEKPPSVTEKHIKASQENLKQIGIAFHAFHDTTNALPVDIVDKTGKPLLSWRVLILPYVEEDRLYRQFKFDEPWDSEHNKKLVAKMPKIYAPIRVKAEAGMTYYQTFTGKDALFGPGRLLLTIPRSMPDGTVNTGLVFEAGEPVVWTKPADLPFDAKQPVPKVGGLFDGEFNVVMGDGSVYRMKKNPDETAMKLLIMPNDGQPTQIEKLIK